MTQVPDNIRTQFSTSTINTSSNTREEANKHSAYSDVNRYAHTQDSRAVNVVEKIKAGIPYKKTHDDPLKGAQLDQKIDAKLANYVTNEDLSELETRVDALETPVEP